MLDMKKPYGTVIGHDYAFFEQGGVLFDATGEELPAEVSEAVKEEKARPQVQGKKLS